MLIPLMMLVGISILLVITKQPPRHAAKTDAVSHPSTPTASTRNKLLGNRNTVPGLLHTPSGVPAAGLHKTHSTLPLSCKLDQRFARYKPLPKALLMGDILRPPYSD